MAWEQWQFTAAEMARQQLEGALNRMLKRQMSTAGVEELTAWSLILNTEKPRINESKCPASSFSEAPDPVSHSTEPTTTTTVRDTIFRYRDIVRVTQREAQ